jgi:hypothetical protein
MAKFTTEHYLCDLNTNKLANVSQHIYSGSFALLLLLDFDFVNAKFDAVW